MADKKYYRLVAPATNFTDPTQPEPGIIAISNAAVKPLEATPRVRKAVKSGAIEECTKKDYDAFLKVNNAAKKSDKSSNDKAAIKKVEADANKKVADAEQGRKVAEESQLTAETLVEEKDKEIEKLKAQLTAGNGK